MKRKTKSELICENFRIPISTIFQDFKCTYRSGVGFFGRLYVAEEHILFAANMFGIVRKCTIAFDRIKTIETEATNSILIAESSGLTHQFTGFKNDIPLKLLRALWKKQKISSQLLIPQADQEVQAIEGLAPKDRPSNAEEDSIEASFFNPRTVDSQKLPISEFTIPCNVEQYFDYFLADTPKLYGRADHLKEKQSERINITQWRKNPQLDADVREITAVIRVTGVPLLSKALLNQVWLLRRPSINQLKLSVVSQMGDLPYCNYFNCEEQIEVQADGENRVKVSSSISIVFNKSTYMKSRILQRTFNDIKEDYEMWIKNVKDRLQRSKKQVKQARTTENSLNLTSAASAYEFQSHEATDKFMTDLNISRLSSVYSNPDESIVQRLTAIERQQRITKYLVCAVLVLLIVQLMMNWLPQVQQGQPNDI